jgi:predicted MFS family arabinose efflux permease
MKLQEKPILLLLAAAQFCNIVDFMIMMPLGHQMMRMFSISAQQFSFLVSSYTFSAGILDS